jgi:hypothetical protein
MINQAVPLIRKHKQRWAAIHQGWQHEALVYEKPDTLFFPLFSLDRVNHNQITGSESFDNVISDFNHTPKPIKKRVLFYANKDNFSELADLDSFAYAFNTQVWVIPYNLFSADDFTHEEMLYFKRLNTSPRLFVHPAHLIGAAKQISQNGICHLMKAEASYTPVLTMWSTFWGLKRILG